MSQISVRVNGRGNAWPVLLGQDHPFYDRNKYEDLANASCSIIKSDKKGAKVKGIDWDLMIDAGHGAVQYLLKNCNRIPEAVFLTHPHIDHTLGLDWIVQSYFKLNHKAYPVYATTPCWEKVVTMFPHLAEMIDFYELIPYQKTSLAQVVGVEVTPFPVYHGKSADGATMLFFTIKDKQSIKRILFTGDLLCPLLREEDYETLKQVDLMVCDANNRFPYPKSNHWSILTGVDNKPSAILTDFVNSNTLGLLLYPHISGTISVHYGRCFDYFRNREMQVSDFEFSISSLIERIKPKNTALIHYSGSEDEKYYLSKVLSQSELKAWIEKEQQNFSFKTKFIIPYVSEHIDFL